MDYENYGRYKKVRDASWRCLIDYDVKALPVSSIGIALSSGIKVLKNSDAHMLRETEFGLSLYYQKKNAWIIVYDDLQPLSECRFIVAHELGHIFQGHEYKLNDGRVSFEDISGDLEFEADRFAIRILAPACVLWGLDLHTGEDISARCDLPLRFALKRAARMAVLYERNKFLTSPLEQKVYGNFQNWIAQSKNMR